MNCKQGDLAVIVRTHRAPEQRAAIGAIIKCEKLISWEGLPAWKMDRLVIGHDSVLDECLRPIRDQPGSDESLSWCDVPQEVAA